MNLQDALDTPVSLKHTMVSNGVITGVAQVAQTVLSLGTIVVLARLLTPQEFGLIAMVTSVMGLLRIFGDGGLSTATIQSVTITHAQVSNLFWTNLALGTCVGLSLVLLAPAVAWYYQEPRLVDITVALAIVFVFTSGAVQHMALMKRQMRFASIAAVQILSAIAGAVVGIAMAWGSLGYWALVGMQVATGAMMFCLSWYFSKWSPQRPRRSEGMRTLLNFGANLTASGFLWSLARGTDGLLIGRFLGAAPLGLYSRAQALVVRPLEQFVSPFESLVVPVLSRVQGDPGRYRRIALEVFDTVAIVTFPFAGMLMPLARPLTLVLLGPQWKEAGEVLAAFALVALYTPAASLSSCLLASQGRGRDVVRLGVVAGAATLIAFLVGLPFGADGVAMAYSITCMGFHLPLHYFITGRSGPVTTGDLYSRFLRYLPLWFIGFLSTYLGTALFSSEPPVIELFIGLMSGIVGSIAFAFAYGPTRNPAKHLFSLARDWMQGVRAGRLKPA
jgi:PST family polysaccharide transporter